MNAAARRLSFDTLGSTNDEAMARGRAGDDGPLWITAGTQTGGRGRHGRVWASPPGNLHASLLLTAPCAPADAPQLGFVAGVALARAARGLAGGDARFTLKWPNDLLHAGAKAAGLLLESTVVASGRLICVIGFGVNCAAHPRDLPYPATDLSAALGRAVTPEEVLDGLDAEMALGLALWRAEGFAAVRAAWLALADGLGRPTQVNTGARALIGLMRSIDAQGRLILDTAAGAVTIDAGDIFPLSPSAAPTCAAQDI